MKKLSALILFVVLSFFASVFIVHAQAAETLWIHSNTAAYKTNETVTVVVNAVSATPIQGFTAQIRYDPACLQPINGTSPIGGMNGLAVPHVAGLADVSYASTTPLTVNGVLAELRFTALQGCQTSLHIESAALVVRSESGFAVPIAGVNIDQSPIVLSIDSAEGNPQPELSGESVLPLAPADVSEAKPINWRMIGLASLAVMLLAAIIGLFAVLKPVEQSR